MDYVFLGKTGVRVSRLAFGTMSFANEADEDASAKMFHACREAGINHFDCADVYSRGRSEEILGELIAPCRDEVVLATKAYFPMSEDGNARGSSRYHLVRAVEASLRRLKTDRIDLFYLHRFDDATDLEETLRAVEDLVRSGKILYPAVSNFSAWQTAKALGIQDRLGFSNLVAHQPMYNLVKRQVEVEILPLAESENLAVFPYSPLGGGLLTGKYGRGRRPKKARIINVKMYAIRYDSGSAMDIAERFTELAKKRGVSPVSLAIAWVMHHPAVTAPILGARNVEQLRPALDAVNVEMDDALYQEIAALSPAPPPATDRNEESTAHNFGSR